MACVGEEQLRTEVWWGNVRERERLEDLTNDGSIIFIGNVKKWDRLFLDWIYMRSSFFWYCTQRQMVVSYRRFATTCRSRSRIKQSKKDR